MAPSTLPHRIRSFFRSRRVRYGGYATLLSAAVIGLVVGANLAVDQLDLRLDLSTGGLYTLSAQTLELLGGLEQDVRIYSLSAPGMENKIIDGILRSYRVRSTRIIVQDVDPETHPEFIRRYEQLGDSVNLGDLVVVGPVKHRAIDSADLVLFSTEDIASSDVQALAAEQQITGAIAYVTSETPVLYQLQGHGEPLLSRRVRTGIEGENYIVRPLTLQGSGVPRDARVLVVFWPQQDFSADEADDVLSFLSGGGSAIFLLDLLKAELAEIQRVIRAYGLATPQAFIVEADGSYHTGNPVELLPALRRHPIIDPLIQERTQVLVPFSMPVILLGPPPGVTQTPLLLSSRGAWGKVDIYDLDLGTKKAGDLGGPLALAAAATASGPDSPESRLVVVGSAAFLEDTLSRSVPGNVRFLVSCLNWLSRQGKGIGITPKSLVPQRLRISSRHAFLLGGLVTILIPGLLLGSGAAIWLRRRNR